MAFLLSMQDSLQALLTAGDMEEEKMAFEWMGLNWWQLAVFVLSISLLILFLIRLIRRMALRVREKQIASRKSEQWYFEELVKAGEDSPEVFMRAMLNWYDRFRKDPMGGDRFGPALESLVCTIGNDDLRHSLSRLEGIVFGGTDPEGWSGKILSDHLREARKKASGKLVSTSKSILKPLNPELEEPVQCKNKA